jgi:hypothetical protein
MTTRGIIMTGITRETNPQLLERVRNLISTSGFDLETHPDGLLLKQVGFSNKSVSMSIKVIEVFDERLIEFESNILSEPTTFERSMLAIFHGNSKCRIAGFTAAETISESEHRFQVIARAHLYADHFSTQELMAMLSIYLREVDAIDDDLRKIVEEKKDNS